MTDSLVTIETSVEDVAVQVTPSNTINVDTSAAQNEVTINTNTGPQGATGAAGTGVPTGGTTGEALIKLSNTDYDTDWGSVTGVPNGGVAD